jgi:hypothetical protein
MSKKSRLHRTAEPPPRTDNVESGDSLHYSSFLIEQFRCIGQVSIDPLKRINLIAGDNNAGKTALLEAVFLHCGAFNPSLVATLAGLRGIGSYKLESGHPLQPPWNSLFRDLDESKRIRLVGKDSRNRSRTITINTTSDPQDMAHVKSASKHAAVNGQGTATSGGRTDVLRWQHSGGGREDVVLLFFDGPEIRTYPAAIRSPLFPGRFIGSRWSPDFPEIAEQFGELEIERKEDVLLKILRLIEPKLNRLSTVLLGGVPMLHADVGIGKLIPVAFLGDGILRLARIILWIIHSSGGVLLIDEVDNGFHHSHLRQIWSAIAACASQFNVQVFATTHSRECIVAAHLAFSETFNYDFRLHRLDRDDEGIHAITYDQESLEAAIESGFEVR